MNLPNLWEASSLRLHSHRAFVEQLADGNLWFLQACYPEAQEFLIIQWISACCSCYLGLRGCQYDVLRGTYDPLAPSLLEEKKQSLLFDLPGLESSPIC
uniref:Uncharacterized protein n=1 Tax=Pyxicephalus adspersus TaxID=30357 RepID=A0AAV3AET2_PYXAD|nr:TPA: hypothetical protein GDO54_014420 [Pyxicephalus adspersus]